MELLINGCIYIFFFLHSIKQEVFLLVSSWCISTSLEGEKKIDIIKPLEVIYMTISVYKPYSH